MTRTTRYIIINSFLIMGGMISVLVGKVAGEVLFLSDLGIALITGGITSLITTLLIHEKNNTEFVENWGLVDIYKQRSNMNVNCDKYLEKCKKNLDFIALGLKGFRDATKNEIGKVISSGVSIRIITVSPDSEFLKQKAIEEGSSAESMSNNIASMIQWAKDVNSATHEGAVQVKTYDGLPMFSYQRIDDHIFVGPNLYGLSSQKCISFEYCRGEGKEYFVNYFEMLWNDKNMKQVV